MRKLLMIAALVSAVLSANAQASFKQSSTGLYLDFGHTLSLGGGSASSILFYPQIKNGDTTSTQYFMVLENDNRKSHNERVMSIDREGSMILNGGTAGIQLWQTDPELSSGMAGHVSLSYSSKFGGYCLSSIGGGLVAPFYYNASEHHFNGDIIATGKIECTGEFKVAEVNTDNIITKDIKVNMNNVADYVFEENYDLKQLSEVESYVKANKHLPGVPSASEIEANGVSLSQMTNLLLEKVEELTLHMIQLEKENQALKNRVSELEK